VKIEQTKLDGVCLITPARHGDSRGWFSETWNQRALAAAGITAAFVQDNHSFSAQAGTLRGLHYQAPPHAQDKLVRCSRGAVLDVAVDVRRGSPRFGAWVAQRLTAARGEQLFIPKGFLHGFVTLEPDTEVQYKCSDFYAPESDGAVRWDSLAIAWELDGPPQLSAKDAGAPHFSEWSSPFTLEDGA